MGHPLQSSDIFCPSCFQNVSSIIPASGKHKFLYSVNKSGAVSQIIFFVQLVKCDELK